MDQKGTITKVEGSKLHISICRPEACGACKAQSACSSMGGGKEIILEDDGLGRQAGEEVTLKIKQSKGITAIILAYLIPVILIIELLLGLQEVGLSEITSGIIAISSVVVYYVVLRLFRNKLESELTITIE